MISLGRWTRWKPRLKARAAASPATQRARTAAAVATQSAAPSLRSHVMPRPVMRWVGEGRIALRTFDFEADVEAIISFQPETYCLNFPDFEYTNQFAAAFRHDLRRAALDPNNGLFVLDDGRDKNNLIGFLWVVVCQNNWTGERYGYVNNLYVAPIRRGAGLGQELMRQSDEWFRSRGVKRVRLTVTSSNEAAAALYQRSGYRVQRFEMEKEL